jgi:hypothetical protein
MSAVAVYDAQVSTVNGTGAEKAAE